MCLFLRLIHRCGHVHSVALAEECPHSTHSGEESGLHVPHRVCNGVEYCEEIVMAICEECKRQSGDENLPEEGGNGRGLEMYDAQENDNRVPLLLMLLLLHILFLVLLFLTVAAADRWSGVLGDVEEDLPEEAGNGMDLEEYDAQENDNGVPLLLIGLFHIFFFLLLLFLLVVTADRCTGVPGDVEEELG